jgi:hypothetical protein
MAQDVQRVKNRANDGGANIEGEMQRTRFFEAQF